MKRALITGITGQDGSYLAEFLLAKGYEVHGTLRGVAFEDPVRRMWRIRQIRDRIHLHACSIESQARLFQVVAEVRPDECYHLAAHSFVNYSFDDEPAIINGAINGTQCMLSAIRELVPRCRFYFATSSEMFGNAPCSPQNEDTPFNPRAPYGIGKVAGYHLTRHYREVYGLAACNGILFNHESERRGREFVTRKITSAAASLKAGVTNEFRLGNLDAQRDWGYAPEYVEVMWRMLQEPEADDYVVATGVSRSVRDLVEAAFACVGLDWRDRCVIDETLFRPAEVHALRGDSSRACRKLGWAPKISFEEMIGRMVEADLERLRSGALDG